MPVKRAFRMFTHPLSLFRRRSPVFPSRKQHDRRRLATATTVPPPGLLSHSQEPSKAIIGRRSSTKGGKDVAGGKTRQLNRHSIARPPEQDAIFHCPRFVHGAGRTVYPQAAEINRISPDEIAGLPRTVPEFRERLASGALAPKPEARDRQQIIVPEPESDAAAGKPACQEERIESAQREARDHIGRVVRARGDARHRQESA